LRAAWQFQGGVLKAHHPAARAGNRAFADRPVSCKGCMGFILSFAEIPFFRIF
jgi:hypothetical protein